MWSWWNRVEQGGSTTTLMNVNAGEWYSDSLTPHNWRQMMCSVVSLPLNKLLTQKQGGNPTKQHHRLTRKWMLLVSRWLSTRSREHDVLLRNWWYWRHRFLCYRCHEWSTDLSWCMAINRMETFLMHEEDCSKTPHVNAMNVKVGSLNLRVN